MKMPMPWSPVFRLDLSLRTMLVALVAQVGISWGAWAPGGRGFPRTPVPVGLDLADWEGLSLILGALGIVLLLIRPRWRGGVLALLLAVALLVMADVNRLQPWLYLYLVVLLGVRMSRESGLGLVRLVVGFAWFWSGVMKMNPSFSADYFPGLMQPFGLGEWALENPGAAYLAGGIEAMAGLLYLVGRIVHARLQKCGLVLGLLVHGFILASLGPFGLNWNAVVWPWNLAFMVMAALALPGPREFRTAGGWGRGMVIVLVGILPALNLIGSWDHFLSHSYYSARVPSTIFYFHPDDRFQIPPQARPHVLEVPGEDRYLIPLERWALSELEIPGYPEIWVRKNTAAQLCACLRSPDKAGLEIYETGGFSSEARRVKVGCGALVPVFIAGD